MKVRKGEKIAITKKQFQFPNLLSEGKKYGLTNQQLSKLTRYLNDKRMLRLISLAKFKEDSKAWLSALTGIIANILEVDAHIAIWLDKKMEKPRNWILSKLNDVIPTEIDDVATKVIQILSQLRDDKILPLEEKLLDKVNSKMHQKYEEHVNASHLGQSFPELKETAKSILESSKQDATDAINTIKDRKFETHVLGGYHDSNGNFTNLRKYSKNASYNLLKQRKENNTNAEETISDEGKENDDP